jgi:hypothetical protein
MIIEDSSFKINRNGTGIYFSPHEGCIRGSFYSKHGIVEVYAQAHDDLMHEDLIRLTFIYDGREHNRVITSPRSIKEKALSMRASSFAREIFNKLKK